MTLSVALLTSAPAWRGSGTSLAKIALGLGRAGHRAVVLTGSEAVVARLEAEGVTAVRVSLHRTGWRELRAVSAALRAVAADVALADTPRDVRLAALATAFRPVPLVFRYNLSRRVLPGDPVTRLFFGRVGAIAYQSRYARDRAHRSSPWLAGRRGEILPNGYDGLQLCPDPEAPARFRRALGLDPARSLVLCGAALFLDKGYATAVEVLAAVAASRPVEVVICGDGDDRSRIAGLAERARVPVRFLGLLSRPAWYEALNAADVVFHPAGGELFANLVAEAMALARPVVAVDSGSTPEVMGRDGGSGVLVPEGDVGAASAAILALLDDPARRRATGTAARARILAEYPLQAMEQGYLRLVEELALQGALRSAGPPARLPA